MKHFYHFFLSLTAICVAFTFQTEQKFWNCIFRNSSNIILMWHSLWTIKVNNNNNNNGELKFKIRNHHKLTKGWVWVSALSCFFLVLKQLGAKEIITHISIQSSTILSLFQTSFIFLTSLPFLPSLLKWPDHYPPGQSFHLRYHKNYNLFKILSVLMSGAMNIKHTSGMPHVLPLYSSFDLL